MSDKTIDKIIPSGRWEFDSDVTDAFEDMLSRSIPQYSVMRDTVCQIVRRFVMPNTYLIDLGASRGEMIARILDSIADMPIRVIATEISDSMLSVLQKRFQQNPQVTIQRSDLRDTFPYATAQIVLSILTIQFTPIEYRQQIVQRIYDHLSPGGVFIMVEKILGRTAIVDDLMVSLYYDRKRKNGYTDEQIIRKRAALEGVLVPMTAHWNEELLDSAGFEYVDCFWRWMNFAGWLAIKRG